MPEQKTKSWETYFHVTTTENEDPAPGELTVTQSTIELTRETPDNKHTTIETISYTDIIDITIGNPPPMFQREFHETINIKFKSKTTNQTETCIIEANPDYNPLFSQGVFKKILSYTEVLFEFGAEKGGRTVESTTQKAKLKLSNTGLQFKTENKLQEIDLGSIIEMKPQKREINGEKKDVLTLKHTHQKTVYTTHVAIGQTDLMRLFRRYIQNTYGELLEDVKQLTVDENVIELIVGLYTTNSVKQTANVVANGEKRVFKRIYKKARKEKLVNKPNADTLLTQRGKLLANKELENVNG